MTMDFSSAPQTGHTPGSSVDSVIRDNNFGPPMNALSSMGGSAPPGATIIDPNVEPSSAMNPRSCVTCRRRKVRCDKHMPCGNCRKAHISCIFPAPGRAPRRPRPKDPNAPPKQTSEREVELMKRLRKLEGIVEELSGQIEVDTRQPTSAGDSPEDSSHPIGDERRTEINEASPSTAPPGRTTRPADPVRTSTGGSITRQNTLNSPIQSPGGSHVHRDFGRLVLNDDGKRRYVSNAFWSRMSDELSALRAETEKFTDEESDESDDDGSTPATSTSTKDQQADHHAFIFGYRSADVDLRKLHPLPSQIPFIWQIYTENVDPIVKILHVPTMSEIVRQVRADMNSLTPGLEALMFAIYYASITSMEENEVQINFNTDKTRLLDQYRFGTEQALAKANFVNTSDAVVVQALTLYIVVVRRNDSTRFSWTLTGLAIRIAQSLGMHREGTQFADLTPFEIEMRRRLWWTLVVVDLRSAEDQGTELVIAERTWDTEFPLNVNDNDFGPSMKEFPPERQGATDVTFCLIRYEICSLARKLHSSVNALAPCPKDTHLTFQEREAMLLEMYNRVEAKYLKPCDDAKGELLHWVAAAIARLIMAKMSLTVYQSVLFPGVGLEVSQHARDRIFNSSVEVVEYSRLLNNEEKCKQYRWLFQTYTNWYAVAYLLLELGRREWSPPMEKAWMALASTFQMEPAELAKLQGNNAVMFPIRKLFVKAQKHRELEIARLRSDPAAAEKLDMTEDTITAPMITFQHLPSSVRTSIALDRWRTIVGRPKPDKAPHRSCMDVVPATTPPNSVRTATPPTTTAATTTYQREPEADFTPTQFSYLDAAMSQVVFNAENIWGAAYESPGPMGRSDGLSNEVQPRITQPPRTISNYANNGSSGLTTGVGAFSGDVFSSPVTSSQPLQRQSQQPQPQATTAATQSDSSETTPQLDNPPPWLWSDAGWNWVPGAANGVPALAAPVALSDDVDVNMDEDFNWQDWQQSIRGFEQDAAAARGLPNFNGGFTGGL
ncbi:fungal-specific transcription factor domain-containing protein [Apiospora arundinis]|uniref:Fungal-specific transcription factor domain-containing protein n=1 Tax=Apiospora arundinis TaxID=335852 RepID=A0ABR2I2P2_9PEZI